VSSAPLSVRAREAASVCKRGAAQGRPSDVTDAGVRRAPLSTERLRERGHVEEPGQTLSPTESNATAPVPALRHRGHCGSETEPRPHRTSRAPAPRPTRGRSRWPRIACNDPELRGARNGHHMTNDERPEGRGGSSPISFQLTDAERESRRTDPELPEAQTG
jgi:hypothetical protein